MKSQLKNLRGQYKRMVNSKAAAIFVAFSVLGVHYASAETSPPQPEPAAQASQDVSKPTTVNTPESSPTASTSETEVKKPKKYKPDTRKSALEKMIDDGLKSSDQRRKVY